ncbi:MAG: polynucleotide adenylyltransferase PcnB [Chlamydiales bacterium]|nr:polynucleotide adenylyltransferase PcnB [Chlamydiia bacterium]MCP5507049.1 polynucleotide adenylyltransferase PcnB [Chlamydiales bacterium]
MKPKTFLADEHEIDYHLIDPDAIYIIEKLRNAGYEAYIVGGSVRDLLCNKTPKDFDISTSARPEEIKKVFGRQCLLIGRRFRLAHIRFGRKIIEVATFRSGDNGSDLITRDNEWGTPADDAQRRDFTINGLFYDPSSHTVIDYVGGWDDIHKNLLKSIGDPTMRFKQDPVRMIRLLKFRARFGFDIDDACANALDSCREEILKSSPARILEEFFRMLESGSSAPFIRLMTEAGLTHQIFPCLADFLTGKHGSEIYSYLEAADTINQEDERSSLDRSVLTAALLFPLLEKEIKQQFLDAEQTPHIGDIIMVTTDVIKAIVMSSFSHFPRRISATAGFILSTQYRFTPFSGKRHHRPKLFQNKEFSLALSLFEIRAKVNPELQDLYEHWLKSYRQFMKQKDRRGHQHLPSPQAKRRRRRGRRRPPPTD